MTKQSESEKKLKWWQLSLLGAAFTIGTGFFLGSHLAIEIGGPAILSAYLLGAVSAYLVFDQLARMTAKDPLEGSFRSYAKKAAHGPRMPGDWLPAGWTGLWTGFIFAFYAYGGLEVMGLMATRLQEPEKAPKAGKVMLLLLGSVYLLSIGLSLLLEPWGPFTRKKARSLWRYPIIDWFSSPTCSMPFRLLPAFRR